VSIAALRQSSGHTANLATSLPSRLDAEPLDATEGLPPARLAAGNALGSLLPGWRRPRAQGPGAGRAAAAAWQGAPLTVSSRQGVWQGPLPSPEGPCGGAELAVALLAPLDGPLEALAGDLGVSLYRARLWADCLCALLEVAGPAAEPRAGEGDVAQDRQLLVRAAGHASAATHSPLGGVSPSVRALASLRRRALRWSPSAACLAVTVPADAPLDVRWRRWVDVSCAHLPLDDDVADTASLLQPRPADVDVVSASLRSACGAGDTQPGPLPPPWLCPKLPPLWRVAFVAAAECAIARVRAVRDASRAALAATAAAAPSAAGAAADAVLDAAGPLPALSPTPADADGRAAAAQGLLRVMSLRVATGRAAEALFRAEPEEATAAPATRASSAPAPLFPAPHAQAQALTAGSAGGRPHTRRGGVAPRGAAGGGAASAAGQALPRLSPAASLVASLSVSRLLSTVAAAPPLPPPSDALLRWLASPASEGLSPGVLLASPLGPHDALRDDASPWERAAAAPFAAVARRIVAESGCGPAGPAGAETRKDARGAVAAMCRLSGLGGVPRSGVVAAAVASVSDALAFEDDAGIWAAERREALHGAEPGHDGGLGAPLAFGGEAAAWLAGALGGAPDAMHPGDGSAGVGRGAGPAATLRAVARLGPCTAGRTTTALGLKTAPPGLALELTSGDVSASVPWRVCAPWLRLLRPADTVHGRGAVIGVWPGAQSAEALAGLDWGTGQAACMAEACAAALGSRGDEAAARHARSMARAMQRLSQRP